MQIFWAWYTLDCRPSCYTHLLYLYQKHCQLSAKYMIEEYKHSCYTGTIKKASIFFIESISETLIVTFIHDGQASIFITEDKISISIILFSVIWSLILTIGECIDLVFLSETADIVWNCPYLHHHYLYNNQYLHHYL